MTDKIRKRFDMRWGSTGVLVSLVDKQYSDRQILERGDLIVQVNQQDVWEPYQFLDKYNEAKKQEQGHILLLVERAGKFLYLLLEI